jgi:hypothetical protein
MGDQAVARPLYLHRTKQTQNKRTQTSMHQVGFEPPIPVFEREKRVHSLDRAATVIGPCIIMLRVMWEESVSRSVPLASGKQHPDILIG